MLIELTVAPPVYYLNERSSFPRVMFGGVAYTDTSKTTTHNQADVTISINGTTYTTKTSSSGYFIYGVLSIDAGHYDCVITVTANYHGSVVSDSINYEFDVVKTHADVIGLMANKMVANLTAMGVTASLSDGGLALADKILDITPAVGGIVLDTSFNANVNTNTVYLGNSVTVTGKLIASYDDTTTTDDDLLGFLQGASVKIYNGSTLLSTVTTDSNGEFTYTYTPVATGTLALRCVYDGTTYYNDSYSSTMNVNVVELNIDDIELATDKEILSYADGESATLTAQLLYEGAEVTAEGVSVDFEIYKDSTLIDTLTEDTDSTGVATVSYISEDTNIFNIQAKVNNIISNTLAIQSYNITAGTNVSITHDNTQLTITNNAQGTLTSVINDLTDKYPNFTLEFDSYAPNIINDSEQIGLQVIGDDSSKRTNIYTNQSGQVVYYDYSSSSAYYNPSDCNWKQKWLHYKFIFDGTYFTMEVYYNNQLYHSKQLTLNNNLLDDTNFTYSLILPYKKDGYRYVKNIKVS